MGVILAGSAATGTGTSYGGYISAVGGANSTYATGSANWAVYGGGRLSRAAISLNIPATGPNGGSFNITTGNGSTGSGGDFNIDNWHWVYSEWRHSDEQRRHRRSEHPRRVFVSDTITNSLALSAG